MKAFRTMVPLLAALLVLVVMPTASAGSAGSGTVRLAHPAGRDGFVLALADFQFNLNNCSDQNLTLQGTDAYVINLWADGFYTDTLTISVTTLGTPEANVPATGLVESVTVRYYSDFCGLLKSDTAEALPYTGNVVGAKWAIVSFSSGAMINFNWSTTNVPA